MLDQTYSVVFPIFRSFPNVLKYSKSNKSLDNIFNKRILFILDKTGSMGGHLNEYRKSSKMFIAKELIKKVITLNSDCSYDILPFDETTLPLCHLENINESSGCTYFSPIISEIKLLLKDNIYNSVVFLSDGLSTENELIAYNAIKMMSKITRENNCIPVSVAIGTDADGEACGLFAESRGYNCFINYEKDLDSVASDIYRGINCVYEILTSGLYVPVESDSNFYYIDINTNDNNTKTTKKLLEKYLNLVIMKYLMNEKEFLYLKSLVEKSVLLLDDETDRNQIIAKYDELLKIIKKTNIEMNGMPCVRSAIASIFRNTSNQV